MNDDSTEVDAYDPPRIEARAEIAFPLIGNQSLPIS
jgi:hypothetical protein